MGFVYVLSRDLQDMAGLSEAELHHRLVGNSDEVMVATRKGCPLGGWSSDSCWRWSSTQANASLEIGVFLRHSPVI